MGVGQGGTLGGNVSPCKYGVSNGSYAGIARPGEIPTEANKTHKATEEIYYC